MSPPVQPGLRLSDADVRRIRALHAAWIALEAAGKDTDLRPFLTDDVVALPHGGAPIEGRAAVSADLFASDGPPCQIDAVITSLEPVGDAALKIATFRTRLADGVEMEGAHVWLLVREDGWKVRFLTWTLG